ncbi:MAG: ABC transporter ATP-binding protein [Myxococcota bacterium]
MTPAITVESLHKTFGSFVAVDHVSFEVGQGEIFGWLGANGAGKSTTIRMLIGVMPPTSGDAVVGGRRVASDPIGVKRRIGYMSQKFSLYPDLTVRQNLQFFGGAYGLTPARIRDRIAAVSDEVDLDGLIDAVTGDLPGGTRQRVALGASLLHEPGIVFLDEPTAGVDPISRRRFWALIRKLAGQGTTVFVTTHHLDEAEQCARIGLMVDGRLVALDTPPNLAATWVPGELYRLTGRGIHHAAGPLRELAGVVELEPFGAALHVRVTGTPPDAILARARTVSPDAAIERTRATLEDVFLAVVRRPKEAA